MFLVFVFGFAKFLILLYFTSLNSMMGRTTVIDFVIWHEIPSESIAQRITLWVPAFIKRTFSDASVYGAVGGAEGRNPLGNVH